MYFYIYDSFLRDKKYTKLLWGIESRLIDFAIQGRSIKLNILNHLKKVILEAVRQGAGTVVVLGDDKTVRRAIAAVVDLDVALGIIPVGSGTHTLAKYLGIPKGLPACEVLSKRVKEQLDVAEVGGEYFTFYLKVLSPYIRITSLDNRYNITPLSGDVEIYVCNFKPSGVKLEASKKASFFRPQDGRMEVIVKGSLGSSFVNNFFLKKNKIDDYTILPFKHIKLTPFDPAKEVRLMLDGDKVIKVPIKMPIHIEVLPKKIKVIVGREREF